MLLRLKELCVPLVGKNGLQWLKLIMNEDTKNCVHGLDRQPMYEICCRLLQDTSVNLDFNCLTIIHFTKKIRTFLMVDARTLLVIVTTSVSF